MKAKLVFLILTVIMALFASGCWDYIEYEDMALVTSTGFDFDKTSNEVMVTVEFMTPGGKGGSQGMDGGSAVTSTGASHKGIGLTPADALLEIQQETGKKLFFGYINVIIVGKEAAENIMQDIIGVLDRTPSIRTTAYVAITQEKAADIVSTFDSETSEQTGMHIRDLITQSTNSGSSFPVTTESFSENLAIKGIEPVASRVTVHIVNKGNKDSMGTQGQNAGIPEGMTRGHLVVDGTAIFRDNKLEGWMEGKEAIGFGLILNKDINPYEIVKVAGGNNTLKTLVLYISKSKTKIKVKLEDGKPVVYLSTSVEADLRKYSEAIGSELLTPDTIKLIEEGLQENIRSEINAAIEKGQKILKADVFGFGFNFYRQHMQLWHKQYEQIWDDIFPQVPVNIKVDAKVVNTGTTIKRLMVK